MFKYKDDVSHISVLQPARPLPVRLELDQSWETWIATGSLPSGRHRDDALKRFRARISRGRVFSSRANTGVPAAGTVAGGRIT